MCNPSYLSCCDLRITVDCGSQFHKCVDYVAGHFFSQETGNASGNSLFLGSSNENVERMTHVMAGVDRGIEYSLEEMEVRVRLAEIDLESVSAAIGVALAYFLRNESGLLLHAAHLRGEKKGYVLVGPSGAGKSTLCANTSLVCVHDDKAAVRKISSRWLVYGVPMLDNKKRGRWPSVSDLAGVFLLSKSTTLGIVRMPAVDAVHGISSQTLLPSGITNVNTYRTILCLASEVPIYRLSFRPNTRFEDVLEKIHNYEKN